jgi:hypothetical protein
VQHNPGLTYIGGLTAEVKYYDVDYLSVWEIEDFVRDLGYVNDLSYWYKLDGNDMEELGNLLTNDEQVVDFMNFVEVYELKSVHIHVKNRVDVLEIVGEVLLLLPPEDDDPNGHGNDHTEGDVEGNIGHTEGDVGHGNGEQGVGYAEGDIGHVEGDVDGNGGLQQSLQKRRLFHRKMNKT